MQTHELHSLLGGNVSIMLPCRLLYKTEGIDLFKKENETGKESSIEKIRKVVI